MKIQKNNSYIGLVEDLNSDGSGVVKIDGYTFFVEGALVGEEIEFLAIKVGKSFGYGKLLNILVESAQRVDLGEESWVKSQVMPLAHLDYQGQLDYKKDQVYQAFKRIGKIENIIVEDTLGMDDPFHYRNKAQVPVQEVDGKLETGFYRRRSHDLIPMEDTYITDKTIDRLVVHVRDVLRKYKVKAYDEKKQKGVIRHIIVKRGYHSGQIMLVLVTNTKKLANKNEIIEDILKFDGKIVSIIQNIQDKNTNVILGKESKVLWGKDYYIDQMMGLDFMISEKSFYQVNTSQAEKLYKIAKDMADLKGDERVLDAYCGIGTISLYLAQEVKEVYGIEIVGQAVEMANKNKELNKIKNAKFIRADAGKAIKDLAKEGIEFDVVFVDPPRKGLDEKFIQTLIKMKVPKIVYISCNPQSQARDCGILNKAGYEVKEVKPVDMFPMTTHVECIALLQREIS